MADETAAPAEAPGTNPAAPVETPAPPEPSPKDLVSDLETRFGGKLTETETRLLTELRETKEAARRAQSAADSNAGRIRREFERKITRLEDIATRGLDENERRAWQAETKVADMEAQRETETDADRDRKARDEFSDYSATLLAEEKIDKDDPVLNA